MSTGETNGDATATAENQDFLVALGHAGYFFKGFSFTYDHFFVPPKVSCRK
jgi:hypothetical protein